MTGTPLFTGADHLGFVTRDLPAAVRRWSDDLGVGPWQVFDYDERTVSTVLCGEAAAAYPMRAALASLPDGFRIEIIEPRTDAGPYHDSLVLHDGRDHLHHVRLRVGDPAAATSAITATGAEILVDSAFAGLDPDAPRLHARYFDTVGSLGFLLEVVEPPPGFMMPEPAWVYPP